LLAIARLKDTALDEQSAGCGHTFGMRDGCHIPASERAENHVDAADAQRLFLLDRDHTIRVA
jgi:hypothetical protein